MAVVTIDSGWATTILTILVFLEASLVSLNLSRQVRLLASDLSGQLGVLLDCLLCFLTSLRVLLNELLDLLTGLRILDHLLGSLLAPLASKFLMAFAIMLHIANGFTTLGHAVSIESFITVATRSALHVVIIVVVHSVPEFGLIMSLSLSELMLTPLSSFV